MNERVASILNRALCIGIALPLLLLCLPIYGVVALTVLAHSGRPVFYVGARLGRHKRVFSMFKFRTLTHKADRIIGGEILSHKHANVLSPLGKFLRDTRLDELPQLFNVLKGDMDLLGPRPVRPEVYEKQCRGIRNFDKRFEVKPGLIGYSQLFTPHSCPPPIRSLIDNRHVRDRRMLLVEPAAVLFTGFVVAWTVLTRLALAICRAFRLRVFYRCGERRRLDRVRARRGRVLLVANGSNDASQPRMALVNINAEAFRI
jgi:lipopolysaccharide/colanic/teichoic acid biosynthesis glycosyltransferase